ncbi:MAG: DUF4199 domain-containing protein [Saprospiraceae bacterium]
MKPVYYGIYAGLATIACYLIFYAISPEMMIKWGLWINLSTLAFYIFAMYIAIWNAGHSDFRLSLREGFTVFIVANALYSLFYYVMFKYFDPKLVDLQFEMMQSRGWTKGVIKREDVMITPGGVFFNYAFSLIGGFILSAIVVWVVNRRRQMYHNQ